MPGKAPGVERELRWRIKHALDAAGIHLAPRPAPEESRGGGRRPRRRCRRPLGPQQPALPPVRGLEPRYRPRTWASRPVRSPWGRRGGRAARPHGRPIDSPQATRRCDPDHINRCHTSLSLEPCPRCQHQRHVRRRRRLHHEDPQSHGHGGRRFGSDARQRGGPGRRGPRFRRTRAPPRRPPPTPAPASAAPSVAPRGRTAARAPRTAPTTPTARSPSARRWSAAGGRTRPAPGRPSTRAPATPPPPPAAAVPASEASTGRRAEGRSCVT